MTCQMYQNRAEILEDYVSGALQAGAAEEVSAHVASCEVCREQVAGARQAGAILRKAYEPAKQPTGAFWTRVRASIREEEQRRASAGDLWGAVEQVAWRLSFGAAALVVLLVGMVIGTQLPSRNAPAQPVHAADRELFPEPVGAAVDDNDVLMELAAGRSRIGRQQ